MSRSPYSIALVTPTYRPDYDRCRLLAESVTKYVPRHIHHYILVSSDDYERFRSLETGQIRVLRTEQFLPGWMREVPALPRWWLTNFSMPVRGWIVQQMRKIGFAAAMQEHAAFHLDSDTFFIRPFDPDRFVRPDGTVRLFRTEENNIDEQRRWHGFAHEILGIDAPVRTPGYIGVGVFWRRDNVQAMIRRIEEVTGNRWGSVLARRLHWSEYILYGDFCDLVLGAGQSGHFHDSSGVCIYHWDESPIPVDEVRGWREATDEQIIMGMVSAKSGTPIEHYRQLIHDD